jgi:hypothetical protein
MMNGDVRMHSFVSLVLVGVFLLQTVGSRCEAREKPSGRSVPQVIAVGDACQEGTGCVPGGAGMSAGSGGAAVAGPDPVSRVDPSPTPAQIEIPEEFRRCTAAGECVDVPGVCGSCRCGAAVNRGKYQEYVLLQAQVCGPSPAISCANGCPGKRADCVLGSCTLVGEGPSSGTVRAPAHRLGAVGSSQVVR